MAELAIALAEKACRPGEELAGVVSWAGAEGVEWVEVRLIFFTRGKGTQDVQVAETVRIDTPGAAGDREFAFVLPNGPYSFSGSLISLTWAVEVLTNGGKEAAREEFVLSPTGQEVLLQKVKE